MMAALTAECVQAMRDAGLDVVEMPGWQGRGEGGSFSIRGALLHHDAMGLHNDNVAQFMSQNGENGAQLWVKYTGQVYVLAAGLKWHAGAGGGWGNIPANGGNGYCVGIETDYSGTGPRPAAIDESIHVLTRVLVEFYGLDPARDLALHKEYAPDRKIDLSNFDADAWRARAADGSPTTPVEEPEPPREWDEMATEDQIRAIIHDELLKFGADPNYSIKDAKTLLSTDIGDGMTLAGELNLIRGLLQKLTAAAGMSPKVQT